MGKKDYSQLDAAIGAAIAAGAVKFNQIFSNETVQEALKPHIGGKREPMRIVDARLQEMKQQRKIRFNGRGNWEICNV